MIDLFKEKVFEKPELLWHRLLLHNSSLVVCYQVQPSCVNCVLWLDFCEQVTRTLQSVSVFRVLFTPKNKPSSYAAKTNVISTGMEEMGLNCLQSQTQWSIRIRCTEADSDLTEQLADPLSVRFLEKSFVRWFNCLQSGDTAPKVVWNEPLYLGC